MSDWRHGLTEQEKLHLRLFGIRTKKMLLAFSKISVCTICQGIRLKLEEKKK